MSVPVTSLTCIPAICASCAYAIRTAGSTLGSTAPCGRAEHRELAGGVPVQRALALEEPRRCRRTSGTRRTGWLGGVATVVAVARAGTASSAMTRGYGGTPASARTRAGRVASPACRPASHVAPRSAPAGVRARRPGVVSGRRVADRLRELDGVDVVVAPDDAPAAPPMRARATRSSTSALADHDLLGARGESVTEGAAELLADADALGVDQLVVRVVGDGVRRDREQPDPAHRGGRAAARPDVRVRPPAGVGRGARRGVARRPHPGAGSRCCDRRSRSPPTARRRSPGRSRPGSGSASARPIRRPSSSTTTTSRRRSRSPSSAASTACTTWRPTAASPAIGCVR